jgi:hypothetical protein
MKAKHSRIALLLVSILCFSSSAHASTAIYIPIGQPSNATNVGGFVGGALFYRAPNAGSVTFNSLGFIDLNTSFPTLLGPDGISSNYQVSLWRIDTYSQISPFVPTSWTLLASTTITPASPLGDSPSDTFRYNSIPPTTINPDEYIIIGATLPTGPLPDKWLNGQFPVNFTGFIGPGTGYTLSGGTFSFAGSPLYIANASTQILPTIPEPTSLSLLAIAGVAMLRRRWRGRSH